MKIHMVLQGKGGVGKSFIAALMAQFLQDRGREPVCIDTDPVNATFTGYSAFGVHAIELMDGRDINPRSFDLLVERIACAGPESDHVIVDNGASSFLPLADYMLSYDVPGLLAEMGHELWLSRSELRRSSFSTYRPRSPRASAPNCTRPLRRLSSSSSNRSSATTRLSRARRSPARSRRRLQCWQRQRSFGQASARRIVCRRGARTSRAPRERRHASSHRHLRPDDGLRRPAGGGVPHGRAPRSNALHTELGT